MGRGGEKTKNIKSPTITEFMKAQNQAYFNNEKLKFYNFIPDIEKEYNVNYPPTAEPMGWASGFIECALLLTSNFLSTFVLDSPCPNIFKPSFRIFLLAFTSLSCTTPQDLQVHSLSESVNS